MSRTRRTDAAALAGLAAALLIVGVACGSDRVGTAEPRQDAAQDSTETIEPGGDVTPAGAPRCGEKVNVLFDRAGAAADGLTMTGEFPAGVAAGGDGTVAGTVTVTNDGPPISGVTSPGADVYIARAGEIVATPLVKDLIGQGLDLGSGASSVFPARGAVRPCAGAETELLPAGRYEVYAVVEVNQADGPPVVVTGGPWPIDVG